MTDENVCAVRQRRDDLRQLRRRYLEALRCIDRDLETLEAALQLAENPSDYDAPQVLPLDRGASEPQAPALLAFASMHMRPRTHVDLLTEMARAHPERTVHLTTAAKRIIADGLSRATRPAHVSATLHSQLMKDPRWAKVGRGQFQLATEQASVSRSEMMRDSEATVRPATYPQTRGGRA